MSLPIENFKPINWEDAEKGQKVYIAGNLVKGIPTKVYGPHFMENNQRHNLKSSSNDKIFHNDWHYLYVPILVEKYIDIKNRHQKEFEALPMFFAFSKEQFTEGMEKFGLKVTDTDKIYKMNYGGFYKREDSKLFKEFYKRQEKEMTDAIESDKTGEGFIKDMFSYELANREFCYTWNDMDALETLGYTYKDIDKNEILANGLRLAKMDQQEG